MLTTEMEAEMNSTSKAPSSKNKYWKSRVKFFGVELCPDNIAVAMVYFVQGVLGLSRLAVSFYLKDDLHLDPAEVYKPCSFYQANCGRCLFHNVTSILISNVVFNKFLA